VAFCGIRQCDCASRPLVVMRAWFGIIEIMIMIMLSWLVTVSIYENMITANAITDPRIKNRLHCTDEAAPVYRTGL
jgi:hypothetical protein